MPMQIMDNKIYIKVFNIRIGFNIGTTSYYMKAIDLKEKAITTIYVANLDCYEKLFSDYIELPDDYKNR